MVLPEAAPPPHLTSLPDPAKRPRLLRALCRAVLVGGAVVPLSRELALAIALATLLGPSVERLVEWRLHDVRSARSMFVAFAMPLVSYQALVGFGLVEAARMTRAFADTPSSFPELVRGDTRLLLGIAQEAWTGSPSAQSLLLTAMAVAMALTMSSAIPALRRCLSACVPDEVLGPALWGGAFPAFTLLVALFSGGEIAVACALLYVDPRYLLVTPLAAFLICLAAVPVWAALSGVLLVEQRVFHAREPHRRLS